MSTSAQPCALALTGERTVPGIACENYWFRRHEVAYRWVGEHFGRELAEAVVVDAGCGEGYGANWLLAANPARVIAIDLDAQSTQHVQTRYGSGPAGNLPAGKLNVVAANLDLLPLTTNSVDVVVTMQVVEHLWDLSAFLRECLRVLRPGGLLVAATPNRLTFSPGLARGQKPMNPFHVEEFDAEQLASLIGTHDFVDVDLVGVSYGASLAAWERRNGDIVSAQVDAILTDQWNDGLTAAVAAISVADFVVTRGDIDSSADLIVIGRAPDVASYSAPGVADK